MLRKILKWTALTLFLLIAGIAITMMFRQHLTYEAPYPSIKASSDTALIAKGKNLVLVEKGCVHCHSPITNIDSVLKSGGEPSLAGAKEFPSAFGTFYTPNLTPDVKTGIGSLSDAEIARVLRYGVRKNGEAVLPFMQGLNMSDEDMSAVVSYLRSLKPVENKVPENNFSLLGRFAKAFMVKPSLPEKPQPTAMK